MVKTKTVSALLYNNDFEVLLHRHKKRNKFLGPGGHVENNEHESEALLREVYEETGIVLKTDLGEVDYQRTRLISPDWVVEIKLDSGDEILYDHTYFIPISPKIRQQQIKTEADNEMAWYDIREVLNNPESFPLYNDTRQKLLSVYIKITNNRRNNLMESVL